MREEPTRRPSDPGRPFAARASRRYPMESYYRDGALKIWPMQLAVLQGLLDRPRGTAKSREDCTNAALPHAARARGHLPSWWRLYEAVAIVTGRGWVRRRRAGRCIRISLTPRGRAIVNGEVVARLYGDELYLPGRRLAKTDADGTVVALGNGIDFVLPNGWVTNIPQVNEQAAIGRRTANGALARLGRDGIMIMAAPHDRTSGPPAFTLMLLPTGLSQEACSALTEESIARLDAERIRPEIDAVARNSRFEITWWAGTARGTVGGRPGLVTRYALAWPNGARNRKETHVAYLGRRQVVAHVYLPGEAGTDLEAGARRILASLRILPARF